MTFSRMGFVKTCLAITCFGTTTHVLANPLQPRMPLCTTAASIEARSPSPAVNSLVCLIDNAVLSAFQGRYSSSALSYCSSYISVPKVTRTMTTTPST